MTDLSALRPREAARRRKAAWKARLANGEHVPRIAANDNHVDALVAGGYLAPDDEFNSEKIGEAVTRLLDADARARERVPGEKLRRGRNKP